MDQLLAPQFRGDLVRLDQQVGRKVQGRRQTILVSATLSEKATHPPPARGAWIAVDCSALLRIDEGSKVHRHRLLDRESLVTLESKASTSSVASILGIGLLGCLHGLAEGRQLSAVQVLAQCNSYAPNTVRVRMSQERTAQPTQDGPSAPSWGWNRFGDPRSLNPGTAASMPRIARFILPNISV